MVGGINWEIGIDIYTHLSIKQITNKDLLYSTGTSTLYSVIASKGKESKKRVVDIFLCVTDSLCCIPETNAHAQLLQSCSTLCDPMGCSPAGFSVRGIL